MESWNHDIMESFVEIICRNYMQKLFLEIIFRNYFQKLFLEIICRKYLQKVFVEIINRNNLQIIYKWLRNYLKILKDPVIASSDQFDLVIERITIKYWLHK